MSELRRLVLAVDRSAESDYACDLAGRLSAATGAELVLFHVKLTHPLLHGVVSPADREKMEREGHELLGDARQRVERAGGTIADAHLALARRIDDAIIREIEEVEPDLVVLGGRGEDELTRRLLLGSIAESVARHAPCSVLVARRPSES